MTQIVSGEGNHDRAGVTTDNRLKTSARSINDGTFAALNNELFFYVTGDITLTDDSESAVLYLKYTGTKNLIVPKFAFTVGASTGGDDNVASFSIYRNPTTLTSGVSLDGLNRNYGSSLILSANALTGGQGYSLSGGENDGVVRLSNIGANILDNTNNPLVLKINNSIGFTITPPANNTSAVYRVGFFAYELSE